MALPASATTTPQGLRSHLFGYSQTSADQADAFLGYYAASGDVANLLDNLGPNAIAIAGRQYIINTQPDYRREMFKHKTIPSQRQSVNLTNVSGQGTINTEGLWRREQTDWSMGAGQKYLDRNNQSAENRFYKSKGIDAFSTPNQLTLQNTTKSMRSSSNTSLAMAMCGSYLYVLDGTSRTSVLESSDWASSATFTAMTFSTSGGYTLPSTIYSIDANNSYVFVATDTGIFYYQAGTTGANARVFYGYSKPDPSTPIAGFHLVRWCNDRVVAASGNYLYVFAPTHSGGSYPTTGPAPVSGDLLMTMSGNPSWWWSDACPGSANIYAAGYTKSGTSNYGGSVYRIGMTVSATAVTPQYPVQTLPMSPDEYPTSIQNYLNYTFLGTNKGIRMCQTLNAYDPASNGNGDLKAGPLIPNQLQPVTSPVRAITADGRYVWFGWSNYDSTSTGLGRLDLSMFIEGELLAPAYQSDLMVDQQGEVLDTVYDPINGVVLIAVSGKGFYRQTKTGDTPLYVTSGTLYTGGFSYGIPDHKIPVFFDYGVDMPDNTPAGATEGYVNADLQVEPYDPSQTQTLSIPAAAEGQSEQKITSGSAYSAELFQSLINIYSDSTHTTAPILYRWTLKAWPAAVSETEISVPVQLHIVNMVDGMETYADPYEQFMFLENLRQNQTIVTYQESTLTANVIIDSLEWVPFKRQGNYEGGFEGDLAVTMKTIGGYNPYYGYPTN